MSQSGTRYKGWRENYFSSFTVSGVPVRTTGTSTRSGACRWDPGRTGRSQLRPRILTKVRSSRFLSVEPGQERKLWFHVVPSLPNPHWQEKKKVGKNYIFEMVTELTFRYPWVVRLFPSMDSNCFLVCLIFLSWELGLATFRLWPRPNYGQTEK